MNTIRTVDLETKLASEIVRAEETETVFKIRNVGTGNLSDKTSYQLGNQKNLVNQVRNKEMILKVCDYVVRGYTIDFNNKR